MEAVLYLLFLVVKTPECSMLETNQRDTKHPEQTSVGDKLAFQL